MSGGSHYECGKDSGVRQVFEERSDKIVRLFNVGIENDGELEENQPDDSRGESEEAEPGSMGAS